MRRIALGSILALAATACSGDDSGTSVGDASGTSAGDTSGTTQPSSTSSEGGGSTAGDDDSDATTGTEESTGTADSTGDDDGSTGGAACTATLFANFDGPTLSRGPSDATMDTTTISDLAMALAPYDGPLDLDEVMAIVEGHFAPFDVCVTRERPARGPYTMVVVTPDNPFGGLGIATLECGNFNPNDVSFVFPNGTWDASARALANVISSEFSPAMGLETQSTDEEDLLCRSGCAEVPDVDRTFKNECIPIFGGRTCAIQHAEHCRSGEQNSFQEMLSTYGAAR